MRGTDNAQEDLNYFRLVQSVQKMKACIQVLINDNPARLAKAQTAYLKNVNINQDRMTLRNNSDVKDFLDRDEKLVLRGKIH